MSQALIAALRARVRSLECDLTYWREVAEAQRYVTMQQRLDDAQAQIRSLQRDITYWREVAEAQRAYGEAVAKERDDARAHWAALTAERREQWCRAAEAVARAVQPWRPVTETEPADGLTVAAVWADGTLIKTHRARGFWWGDPGKVGSFVEAPTHWQPLPAPPQFGAIPSNKPAIQPEGKEPLGGVEPKCTCPPDWPGHIEGCPAIKPGSAVWSKPIKAPEPAPLLNWLPIRAALDQVWSHAPGGLTDPECELRRAIGAGLRATMGQGLPALRAALDAARKAAEDAGLWWQRGLTSFDEVPSALQTAILAVYALLPPVHPQQEATARADGAEAEVARLREESMEATRILGAARTGWGLLDRCRSARQDLDRALGQLAEALTLLRRLDEAGDVVPASVRADARAYLKRWGS